MIRSELVRQLDHDPNFKWRGEAVTRIENLSDIVFALALGMLVSASTPPQTYPELLPHLLSIIPITAGFAIMLVIWNAHFMYFRRYGMADGWIIFLNAVLLLFILFIAYPLRFAFESLFAFIIGAMGDWSRMEALGIAGFSQAGTIVALFSVGLALVYILISLMYQHALRNAKMLDLSAAEIQITKQSLWRYRAEVLIACLMAAGAAFTPLGPMAGAFGALNWPAAALAKRLNKIRDEATVPAPPQ